MDELLRRAVTGLVAALIALIWLLCRWRRQRACERAGAAWRQRRVHHVVPQLAPASAETRVFLRAIRSADDRARGPAVLLAVWDLYRIISAVPRGAVERALTDQLGIAATRNPFEGLRRDDRRQLTLLYAIATAMRPEGFRLIRVGEEFIVIDHTVQVRIGARGRLDVTPRRQLSPKERIVHAWTVGARSWPRWPFDRVLARSGDRAARVPEASRQLLSFGCARSGDPLDAGLFVATLVGGLDVKELERAAIRRGCGTREVLRGCSSQQLALLLCCDARITGKSADPRQLPFEFNGVAAVATWDGVVRNGKWAAELAGRDVQAREPEPGFEFHPARSSVQALLAAGAAFALAGRVWLAALALVLWIAVDLARGYLGSYDRQRVASAIPRVVGVAVGTSYAVPYMPGEIIAAIGLALGVSNVNTIGYLAVLPYLAFMLGMGSQLITRRYLAHVRNIRGVMYLTQSVALVGVALSPTASQMLVWISLAAFAGAVAALLKSEATAEQNSLRGTRGKPLVGMNFTFIATIGVLLIAPSVMPQTRHAIVVGLAPARMIFMALALVSFVAWRLLPMVLEVDPGTWEDAQPARLRDAVLWRAVGLTALTLGAQTGALTRLNEVFASHGSADPIRWTAWLQMSIFATAAMMPLWDKFTDAHLRRAELVAILTVCCAGVLGLLSKVLGLHGFWWYALFGTAVVLMDAGVTCMWACAEAVALSRAEDVGRAAVINAGRYALLVLVGLWSAHAGSSEVESVHFPALACAGAALLLFFWRPDRRLAKSPKSGPKTAASYPSG
jgi:hypothetical protein